MLMASIKLRLLFSVAWSLGLASSSTPKSSLSLIEAIILMFPKYIFYRIVIYKWDKAYITSRPRKSRR